VQDGSSILYFNLQTIKMTEVKRNQPLHGRIQEDEVIPPLHLECPGKTDITVTGCIVFGVLSDMDNTKLKYNKQDEARSKRLSVRHKKVQEFTFTGGEADH